MAFPPQPPEPSQRAGTEDPFGPIPPAFPGNYTVLPAAQTRKSESDNSFVTTVFTGIVLSFFGLLGVAAMYYFVNKNQRSGAWIGWLIGRLVYYAVVYPHTQVRY